MPYHLYYIIYASKFSIVTSRTPTTTVRITLNNSGKHYNSFCPCQVKQNIKNFLTLKHVNKPGQSDVGTILHKLFPWI